MPSTLLYGAETWPITVANGRRLEAALHRWLRRILHVTWRDKITNKIIRERTRQDGLHHQKEKTDMVGSCGQNELE